MHRSFVDILWHTVKKVVMEWISVKDKMPQPDKYVLGYCSYGEDNYEVVCWSSRYNEFHHGLGYSMPVSHWMPLPEPPKE